MTAEAAPAIPVLRIDVGADVGGSGSGRVVVRVSGELDTAAAAGLRGAIAEVLARPGVQECVVDLSAVTFLDCAGLQPLVAGHVAAVGSGRTLRLRTGPDPAVDRVLQLTGLGDVLVRTG
ncbi:STAS domain-containing protein [Klenkia soli]|uniref:Anti-sigma factor antagonist n=1 Tax=Klenkia soli TaxID=1052260 RepID=A0A1H0SKY9_9ACTN|nr:STAS domain-containing protein [Klenkia soli]SDP42414.1 STAS domain-containing protein [Klenkia soli]